METFVNMQILVHIIKQDKELLSYNKLTTLKILPTLPAYWEDTQADTVFPLHCARFMVKAVRCNHHLHDRPWDITYTGCNRRNGPDFGRVFLRSNYTDITQNTYIQS
jgi:hypothetical protein